MTSAHDLHCSTLSHSLYPYGVPHYDQHHARNTSHQYVSVIILMHCHLHTWIAFKSLNWHEKHVTGGKAGDSQVDSGEEEGRQGKERGPRRWEGDRGSGGG